MGSKSLFILGCALVASVSGADRGVPFLMWKSPGALPALGDLSLTCSPASSSNDDFKVKVLEGLDKVDNVVLFIQDTLGIEDFSKYGKAAYAYVSSAFHDSDASVGGHLYLPRVVEAADASLEALGRTRKVSEINEVADPLRVAAVLRSSPRNLVVIRLKTDGAGRLDELIEKDVRIKGFIEAAAARTDNFVAILTGERTLPIDLKRPRRQVSKNIQLDGKCVDVTAESLTIRRGSKAEVAGENKKEIDVPLQVAGSTEDVCDPSSDPSATFELDAHSSDLTDLKLRFDFVSEGKDWKLPKIIAEYRTEKGDLKTAELKAKQSISRTKGKTFSAMHPVEFASLDNQFSLIFNQMTANPYPKDEPSKAKVRATADPAQNNNVYFSIPILSALTVSLLFIIIMTWALDNITSIKTMDQFDDPRGKTITVPVSD